MISVIALHFVAGAVAGSMFTVRTLLALVAIVVLECITATAALGFAASKDLLWNIYESTSPVGKGPSNWSHYIAFWMGALALGLSLASVPQRG